MEKGQSFRSTIQNLPLYLCYNKRKFIFGTGKFRQKVIHQILR